LFNLSALKLAQQLHKQNRGLYQILINLKVSVFFLALFHAFIVLSRFDARFA
jgi:hypothetical protein